MTVKNDTKMGRLQREMMDFIEAAIGEGHKRFSIHRDTESRRIAASLEKRGLIKINRDFECWVIRLA